MARGATDGQISMCSLSFDGLVKKTNSIPFSAYFLGEVNYDSDLWF